MARYRTTALAGTITGLVLAILLKIGIWLVLAWAVQQNFPLTYGQSLIVTGGVLWLIDTIQSKKA